LTKSAEKLHNNHTGSNFPACQGYQWISNIYFFQEEKMSMKRTGLLLAVLFVAVTILTACQTAAPTEVADTELNVLCTPQEEWCQGMKQEFEAKYGITVNYVRMSSGEALARVEAEKDAPTFDIWWGGPIDSFVAAKEKGLLERYDSPNYGNIREPELMKDADNQWVGVYVGTLGFATNKD